MRTITLRVDDSIYQKFLTLIELFPKSKLKIIENYDPKPNAETIQAMKDVESGKNCESFSSAKEMFKAFSA